MPYFEISKKKHSLKVDFLMKALEILITTKLLIERHVKRSEILY